MRTEEAGARSREPTGTGRATGDQFLPATRPANAGQPDRTSTCRGGLRSPTAAEVAETCRHWSAASGSVGWEEWGSTTAEEEGSCSLIAALPEV